MNFETEAKNYLLERLGASPQEISFDSLWHRFETKGKTDGSYCAYTWNWNGKEYARVFFIDFAGSQEVLSWKSWSDKTLPSQERKKFVEALHHQEIEAKAALKENYEKSASELHEYYSGLGSPLDQAVYLTDKKIKNVPDPKLRYDLIQKCLVIPLVDTTGKFWNVQKIYDNGNKFYTKGAKKKGCFHLIGSYDDKTNLFFICEGYATGASVHLATNKPVFVVLDTHNLKHLTEQLTQLVRSKSPEAVAVIAGDDDKYCERGNPGRIAARAATEGCIGVTCAFPRFRFNDQDKRYTDFNDLYIDEGLEAVQKQLGNHLFEQARLEWYSRHGAIWSIQKEKSETFPLGYSITGAKRLTNYKIEKEYELYDEERKEITRHVSLNGRNEDKSVHIFNANTVKTSGEYETWLFGRGNGLVNYEDFTVKGLKIYLDRVIVPRINLLSKFGKVRHGAWIFKNCLINQGEIKKPNEFNAFFYGWDKFGRKLGFKLKDSVDYLAPSLNLSVPDAETPELVKELFTITQAAYSFPGVMALGYAVSTLFMDEIAEALGTNQFPTLNLYGEPSSGKSNLIKILECLHGFSPNEKVYSGVPANSTRVVLENVLMRSRSLIAGIYEVKPDYMAQVEQILQMKYDGQLRQKSVKDRATGEWGVVERKPECALVCDSNHTFQMESVIDRLIPLEFTRENFDLEEAKKLNGKLKELSAITRCFLTTVDGAQYALKVKACYEQVLAKGINTRQALGIAVAYSGIHQLIAFGGIEGEEKDIQDWIFSEFGESVALINEGVDLCNEFFEFFFSVFSPKIKREERTLPTHEQTPPWFIKMEEPEKVFIPMCMFTRARFEFLQLNKYSKFSKLDVNRAVRNCPEVTDWQKAQRIAGNWQSVFKAFGLVRNAQSFLPDADQ